MNKSTTIIYLCRENGADIEIIRDSLAQHPPRPGDTLVIGDTVYGVAYVVREDLTREQTGPVYRAWCANLDGAMGWGLGASR